MEFIHGCKKVFDDFIKSINSEDRIALISHNDVDGIVSAFLLHSFLTKKGHKPVFKKFISYQNNFIGGLTNELERKEISVVFFTDLQVDSDDFEGFKKLSLRFKTFLLDHHPLVRDKEEYKILKIIKCPSSHSTGFMVYELGKNVLDENYYEELMLSSLISDYGFKDSNLLKLIQNKYGASVNEENVFETTGGELAKKINSALTYCNGDYEKVWKILEEKNLEKLNEVHSIVDEELQRCVKYYQDNAEYYEKENLYYLEYTPKYPFTSTMTTILSGKNKDATYILVSKSLADHSKIKVSGRNQNGKYKMNILLKKAVSGLDEAVSGGHDKASGATFLKKDLTRFKEQLLRSF